jgi:hypothetical protein
MQNQEKARTWTRPSVSIAFKIPVGKARQNAFPILRLSLQRHLPQKISQTVFETESLEVEMPQVFVPNHLREIIPDKQRKKIN